MVTIILGNTKGKLLGLRNSETISLLDRTLSYEIQGHQFMQNKGKWDGRYRLFDKNYTFPIGLLSSVINILGQYNLEYEIKDNRLNLEYGDILQIDPFSGFEPRDYQEDIVDKAWKSGGGIIRAATRCSEKR